MKVYVSNYLSRSISILDYSTLEFERDIKLDENIESAHITVKYTGTTIEKVSYLISAISIITFIGYVIYSKKQDI